MLENILGTVLLTLLLCTYSVFGNSPVCRSSAHNKWEFAVTTNSKVLFYDVNWNLICTDLHHFKSLAATTFDEAGGNIYFNDREVKNVTIFSIKLDVEDKTRETFVRNLPKDESINGITYDPLNRTLYWTDSTSIKIYKWGLNASSYQAPKPFISFQNNQSYPEGIALDFCQRKLYWVNSNIAIANIESSDLDGGNRKVIIKDNLYMPRGIVVDQYKQRIYLMVVQHDNRFTIESFALDGSDRQVLYEGKSSHAPSRLAVTRDRIYWNEYKSIKSFLKNGNIKNASDTVLTLENDFPKSIVARTHYLTHLIDDEHCAAVLKEIKQRHTSRNVLTSEHVLKEKYLNKTCLNDGEYNAESGYCICAAGFSGGNCEINECHNYCINGLCSYNKITKGPKCQCTNGYYGERCELEQCFQYCLNDGKCAIGTDGKRKCECVENYAGERCEQNLSEICVLYCEIPKEERTTMANGYNCDCNDDAKYEKTEIVHEYVEEQKPLSIGTTNKEKDVEKQVCGLYCKIPTYERYTLEIAYDCTNYCQHDTNEPEPNYVKDHEEICKRANIWTASVIIALICGVVACLFLVLLIVKAIHRFYKPLRPKIKKTFVVRKNTTASDTPLTNRPIATEQCEITIENCCNMNICETPCFDPKLMQQSFTRTKKDKDDKIKLITDDDLY